MRYLLLLLLLCTPVWADAKRDETDIRKWYDQYQKAYVKHDLPTVMKMTTPDFTARMKDGTELSRDKYQDVMKQQLQTTGKESLKVVSMKLAGNTATVDTEETLSATTMGHEMGSICTG
ncbi:MAG TPA: nuclear transport factor 2 family protein, partial [Candidatus Xenobia bacterium]